MMMRNWTGCTMLTLWLLVMVIHPLHAKDEVNLNVGDPAPTFVLRDLQGKDFFLRDFCGKKLRKPWINKTKYVVVLSFFTSYCQPCKKEVPELQDIARKYSSKNLKIFLVNLKEEPELVKKCIKERGYTLPVLLDRYGMTAKKYGVSSVPRIFIIDKDGNLAWMTKGFDKQLKDNLDRALATLLAD